MKKNIGMGKIAVIQLLTESHFFRYATRTGRTQETIRSFFIGTTLYTKDVYNKKTNFLLDIFEIFQQRRIAKLNLNIVLNSP